MFRLFSIIKSIILIPFLSSKIKDTKKTQSPIKYSHWIFQKVLGINIGADWPVHWTSKVVDSQKIDIGVDCCPGYMGGCYIQGKSGIKIGDYTQIAANVGIISGNHSVYDTRVHVEVEKYPSIVIGKYCWIGMNSIILPGVTLGNFVTVGSGSVVTKSFEEDGLVLAGNPAKVIKRLNKEELFEFENKHKYIGYKKKI